MGGIQVGITYPRIPRYPTVGTGSSGNQAMKSPTRLRFHLQGLPGYRGRIVLYDIKVSFGRSGTLKSVIPVENCLQKRSCRLADYNPPSVVGC